LKKKLLRVVVPLDPAEGTRYVEPVCDYDRNDDLDFIYKITVWEKYWVNPTTDGRVSWEREISFTSYSNEEIE